MDKATLSKSIPERSLRFRSPGSAEKQLGLWVDRIGRQTTAHRPDNTRLLGLYAAVCAEKGDGFYFSPATGNVKIREGDVMIVFPDVPHAYGPDEIWTSCFIVWDGPESVALEQLGILDRQNPIISGGADIVTDTHRRLTGQMELDDMGAILNRKVILLEMLSRLHACRHHAATSHVTTNLEHALAYMRENYQQHPSVVDCARKANLSVTHFRRCFKTHTGVTPKEFLTSLQMNHAKHLLSEGVPIKETAQALGYDDVFYFMRHFKKSIGIPPGQFQSM